MKLIFTNVVGVTTMSELQEQQVLKSVMQSREKILILEKIVQELVNTGYVD
jgi:tetrahydromethanopterin S-methyltransferase subunit B